MSQKQLDPTNEFGPKDSTPLTGNKEAQAASDKAKALLDAVAVDKDALLLAERNAAIDFALEKFGETGGYWCTGALGKTRNGVPLEQLCEHLRTNDTITASFAEMLRTQAYSYCAIGGLASGEGIFSHAAIDAAVSALARTVDLSPAYGRAYGYEFGDVFEWNDRQGSPGSVISAFKSAKTLPLR